MNCADARGFNVKTLAKLKSVGEFENKELKLCVFKVFDLPFRDKASFFFHHFLLRQNLMLERFNNLIGFDAVRDTRTGHLAFPVDNCPRDPRVKCIEWAWGEPPTVVAIYGDFSDYGLNSTETKTAHYRISQLLEDSQIQKIFDQFKNAIDLEANPLSIELSVIVGDSTCWVEQEAVLQIGDDGTPRMFCYWYEVTRRSAAESKAEILKQVIDAIPSWIFLKNRDHNYEFVNSAYATCYGVEPEECIGKNSVDLGVPEELAKGNAEKGIRGFWTDDREVFDSGEAKEILCEPITINGEQRFLQTIKSPIAHPQTGQELLVGFCHDITYMKQIEERIGLELRHNKTLNEVNHLLRSVEDSHEILDPVCELLSCVLGGAEVEIQDCISETGTSESVLASKNDLPASERYYSEPIEIDGLEIARLNINYQDAGPTDADKALLSAVRGKLSVAFHRQQLLTKINYQANHDSLTMLPNRPSFLSQLEDSIEESNVRGQRCAVIMLDLDGFKTVNDTFGHSVGDQLLLAVAERLGRECESSEVLARLGGDEFAVLLTEIENQSSGIERAESFVQCLGTPFIIGGRELVVGTSAGVSFSPDDSNEAMTLLQQADWAMYSAKESGRNRCQLFTREMAERTQHRIQLESDLRRAISEGEELYMVFQPKFDIATKKVTGVEALVRWPHPEFGAVSPEEFIQIAQETGLIVPLGQWIMRESCQTVANWNRLLKTPIQLSLNITPPELEHRSLIHSVARILEETEFKPELLDFELTETFVMKRFDAVSRRLEHFRKKGITISIDDFGTGYSCMSYLHRLPVDCLKIDKSFIQMLDFDIGAKDARRVSITQTVVTLAQTMGLTTVAEGIETENQLQHLMNLGVDVGQGYLFSGPLRGPDAFEFIQQHNS